MTPSHDDVLHRIDHLKSVAPSEKSTRRAIAKATGALLDQPTESSTVSRKRNTQRRIWKFALAGCMAASLVAVACFVSLGSNAVAFAEVQDEIKKMRTVIYNVVSGDTDARMTSRHIISGTRVRTEWPGHTRIRVPEKKTIMFIDHEDRRAVFHRVNSDEGLTPTDLYGRLVSIQHSSVKKIGKRTIGGKAAIGFEVPEIGSGKPMLVWVDPQTRLPIRIEAVGGRVLQDFQFNVPVAEDLFQLTSPAGYFEENRYEALQSPMTLGEDELQQYVLMVTDPNRSPQETIRAYLTLAAAGKINLVRALQRNPSSDDIRELDGFRRLKVDKTYLADSAALGITSAAIAYRGKRRAMVFTVKPFDGTWLIDDIDLESAAGVEDEIKRFLAEYPEANVVE